MAFAHSPKIVTDGMVFYYDTGNSKSYAGEPTENLVNNADFSNGTTNWNENQNVTLSVETIDETRLLKISSNQTNSTPGLKSANIPVTGNTTYTLTIRAYKNDSQSAFMYATGNGTGGADIVWSTSSLNGPNPITTELTTISRTFTTPSDMTYIQVGFLWSAPLTTSEVYVEYVQLEQKSHATPFVNGTRSATEALKDFTKNATLDLSNVSFDSNAQMTFDGTDDYLLTGFTRGTLGDDFTLSAWYRYTGTSGRTYTPIFGGIDPGSGTEFFVGKNSGNTNIGVQDGNYSGSFVVGSNAFDGNYHHIIYTYSNGVGKIYLDGVLKNTGNFTKCNVAEQIAIGYEAEGSGYYFIGDISKATVHNRALSAEEIQQNFNTIKGRFGI